MRQATKELQSKSERGIALVVVLAFVVLLATLVVAYLSRTSTSRQVAHGSFNDAKADQLARSAVDIAVADLKQEIVTGSTPDTVNDYTIYVPNNKDRMLPLRTGNPGGSPDPIPNLVRRSVSPDNIVSPGVKSRASAVNSTTDISLNNRSISVARWNKHYLIPRLNAGSTATDTTPIADFTAPDWVFVTSAGPGVITKPSSSVVGRYAYAIYDEGGLIDVNVAGYPSPSPSPMPASYVKAVGRKGSAAFADLTALGLSNGGIGDIVGWRNYASIQPSGSFTSFGFDQTAASRFLTAVFSNTNGFMTVSGTLWNNRTDQIFPDRQALIKLRGSSQFTQDALQYLGTFSRELNRPTWKPSAPTSINPDLAITRVTTGFTRFDGTSAVVGEPLLKTRFPLPRLSWLTYKGPSSTRAIPAASPAPATTDPDYDMWQLVYVNGVSPTYLAQGTAANIKTCLGLAWDSRAYVASPRAGQQWVYISPSSANSGGTFDGTAGTAATVIKTLSTVQAEAREPDFFEMLKAVILNGSVGVGSGAANTFIAAEPKYYDNTGSKSSDYQLMQIGANIMDEWDADNFPSFINFNGNEPTGVENIPFLNKLAFCPNIPPQGGPGLVDAWLVPSLWNPHQNATSATGTIRVALISAVNWTATATAGAISTTSPAISPPATIDVPASGFIAPIPPADPAPVPLATTGPISSVGPPEKYYGFHFPFDSTTPNAGLINQKNADTAYPDFGSGGQVELQIQIPGTSTFIPYQTWKITATGHPLTA